MSFRYSIICIFCFYNTEDLFNMYLNAWYFSFTVILVYAFIVGDFFPMKTLIRNWNVSDIKHLCDLRLTLWLEVDFDRWKPHSSSSSSRCRWGKWNRCVLQYKWGSAALLQHINYFTRLISLFAPTQRQLVSFLKMLSRMLLVCLMSVSVFSSASSLSCRWMDHKFSQHSLNSLNLIDAMVSGLL